MEERGKGAGVIGSLVNGLFRAWIWMGTERGHPIPVLMDGSDSTDIEEKRKSARGVVLMDNLRQLCI